MYVSNAQWPKGTISLADVNNTSTDTHNTKEQADAICRMLEKQGFGGEGKIFPIKTWVGEK